MNNPSSHRLISRCFSQNAIKQIWTFIPHTVLHEQLKKRDIIQQDFDEIRKEDLIRYYNRRLLSHMKYQQWDDFFFLYHNACELNHGVDYASHVLAAHTYLLAYKNYTKAHETLSKLPKDNVGGQLSLNIFETYKKLDEMQIAPLALDWSIIASMCSAAALGTKLTTNKWEKLAKGPRLAWHYELRPWRYPQHIQEIADYYRFKQRGDK